MPDLQFIGHDLVCMFPVSLAQVFMEKNPMDDCKASINTIYDQEEQISNILGSDYNCA